MRFTCERHPTLPAWWLCPRCNKSLCPQCISKRKGGHMETDTFYFCPACNVEAQSHELSQVITPFWARLPKFFIYPFSSLPAVGFIFGLALLATIFNGFGFFSFWLQFAFWALMVKYSFESLKSTSEGHFRPPALSSRVLVENYGVVFKQIALYLALILLYLFVVPKAGLLAMRLYPIICGIGLPAMLILLIINDDLGRALNPLMVIGIIFRIGGSYFLLLFFLALLASAPAALGQTVIQHLPIAAQSFLMTCAKNYYTLISYHMMGYIILQYHHRLDYDVELETILASMYPAGIPESQNSADASSKPQYEDLLKTITLLVQEGKFEEAIGQIEKRVKPKEISDWQLSERYYGLLKMTKKWPQLLQFAPYHLELLIKKGSKSKALDTYTQCLRLSKTFAPRALIIFKIAEWLNDSAKPREAIVALNSLIKSHPEDPLVPKAYYRAAQLFSERLMDAKKARKVLSGLIRKYPDHEVTVLAKRYLSNL